MSVPGPLVVLCTAPSDPSVVERLSAGLVQERLAACVNAIPGVSSTYRWEGRIETASETQLVIKTNTERFDALCAWLEQHHPYETPEILGLPVTSGSVAYLSWLEQEVTPTPG